MESFPCSESSNLHWRCYNEATRVLEVDFKGKDGVKVSTYRYQGFPPELWAQWNAASEKGKFFAFSVRPHFLGVKIWSAAPGVMPKKPTEPKAPPDSGFAIA